MNNGKRKKKNIPTRRTCLTRQQLGRFLKVDLRIIWDEALTPPEIPGQICHGVVSSSGGADGEVKRASDRLQPEPGVSLEWDEPAFI